MESAFATPTNKVLAHFNVDDHDGLTDKQVEDLRAKYGRNCTPTLPCPACPAALVARILY